MSLNLPNHQSVDVLRAVNGVVLLQFKGLLEYGDRMKHCFTTRVGGVSTGECVSLNLGFNRSDDRQNVLDNFKLLAEAMNFTLDNMVLSNQVHDNKIKRVTARDRGKGILRESDILGMDGLMTNETDIVLVTFYADCVPVYLYDPVKNAICVLHSGWKSTLKEISKEAVKAMETEFGSAPQDLIAVVGPSIGNCCFEIDEDVYEKFLATFPLYTLCYEKKSNGKWHIDLWALIKRNMIELGLNEEDIHVSQICTKCNKDVFFSYRGDCGKTGVMAAAMQLTHK